MNNGLSLGKLWHDRWENVKMSEELPRLVLFFLSPFKYGTDVNHEF